MSSNITSQKSKKKLLFFLFYLPYLPPFTRKRIVSLYFGREVRTRLGVAFFEVYRPPVFHIKVGRPVECLAQGHNKRTCRLVLVFLHKTRFPTLWVSATFPTKCRSNLSSLKMIQQHVIFTTKSHFWCDMSKSYPQISKLAFRTLLHFTATYLCECGFLTLLHIKTMEKNRMKGEHDMRLPLSNMQPQI